MKHIPSRHFSNSLSFEEIWEIKKQYSGSDWDFIQQFLSETQQITRSAIRVSEVIKRHFDIDLFPTIFKVAGKGWDAAGGTAYFSMRGKDQKVYLFWTPARTFQAINGVYYQDNDDGFYRE